MVQSLGAQIGLLAFSVAILAGLYAGNSLTVILTRALIAMVVGSLVGQVAGWAAKVVLRDYLQKKKFEIDRAHIAGMRGLAAPAGDEPEQVTDSGEAG